MKQNEVITFKHACKDALTHLVVVVVFAVVVFVVVFVVVVVVFVVVVMNVHLRIISSFSQCIKK